MADASCSSCSPVTTTFTRFTANHIDPLPVELIRTILVLSYKTTYHPGSRSRFPFCASHVSRQWRKIVLATPELWTYFRSEKYSSKGARALQLLIQRSGQEGLDISLKWSDESTASPTPYAIALLPCVSRPHQRSRWLPWLPGTPFRQFASCQRAHDSGGGLGFYP